MTLEKECSDTEIHLAARGIEPGASSTRGKCLTTELRRFPIFQEILQHDVIVPSRDNPLITPRREKTCVFGVLRRTKAQTSLPIRAV